MGNLLSSTAHIQCTRSSSPLATNNDVRSTSLQGITPSPPPQGPRSADVSPEAVLPRVIHDLRKHVPELYRQLRVGTQFDPDVFKIILDSVDKASGGMPWPVGLALQAVLFLADTALQAQENAIAGDALASTIAELRPKLQRLKDLRVPDEHQNAVQQITVKLIAASAVVKDIVERSSSTQIASFRGVVKC